MDAHKDPDPDPDPKKIGPDPQHCYSVNVSFFITIKGSVQVSNIYNSEILKIHLTFKLKKAIGYLARQDRISILLSQSDRGPIPNRTENKYFKLDFHEQHLGLLQFTINPIFH